MKYLKIKEKVTEKLKPPGSNPTLVAAGYFPSKILGLLEVYSQIAFADKLRMRLPDFSILLSFQRRIFTYFSGLKELIKLVVF